MKKARFGDKVWVKAKVCRHNYVADDYWNGKPDFRKFVEGPSVSIHIGRFCIRMPKAALEPRQ